VQIVADHFFGSAAPAIGDNATAAIDAVRRAGAHSVEKLTAGINKVLKDDSIIETASVPIVAGERKHA